MNTSGVKVLPRLLAATLCGCLINIIFAEEVHLGGVRDAVAEIGTQGESLECKVSFVPVRAFDKPLNAGINRTKAEFYCRRALIIWSKIPDGSTVTFSGLRPIGAENGGERYSQVFAISKDGIQAEASPAAKSEGAKTERNASEKSGPSAKPGGSLLERVEDHLSTINLLVLEMQSQFSLLTDADLDGATADLEQRIRDAMVASRKEVLSDRLLLGIEKSRISAQLDEKQEELIERLSLVYKAKSKNH